MTEENPFDDIPGTTLFDAHKSREGYHLNMFCMSMGDAASREEFKQDERAYLARYPMTEEQRDCVLRRDALRLIEIGGNIYFLAKLFYVDGRSVRSVCAAMSGMTDKEYEQMMLDGGRSPEGNRSKSEWAQSA